MKHAFYRKFLKRFLDIILSFLAIVILSPIFLLTIILSEIFIGGNVFFKQYRPGKDGKIFPFIKFRSMTNKKDKDGNLLPDKDRITWWGKIIRKTSIDELPQLFNILVGHMSIVGPRPRLIKDMLFYDEETLKAYSVRPGLTGPAQVYDRRSESSWDDVFRRDLEYAEKVSLWTDIKLIFGTFAALFKGGSASGAANAEKLEKREYYYPDDLLKSGKITKEQYDLGLERSKTMENSKSVITYQKDLHEEK